MSIDEYRDDILKARSEGFNIVYNLETKLNTVINTTNPNYDSFMKIRELCYDILKDLKKLDLTKGKLEENV